MSTRRHAVHAVRKPLAFTVLAALLVTMPGGSCYRAMAQTAERDYWNSFFDGGKAYKKGAQGADAVPADGPVGKQARQRLEGGVEIFERTDYEGQPGASASAVGDFDNDGNLDVAVVNASSNEVAIFWGDGNGGFSETRRGKDGQRIHFAETPTDIVVGDFNGDGKLDMAVTSYLAGKVYILLNSGGTFIQGQTLVLGAYNSLSIAAGDFNGDGVLDLAVTQAGTVSNPGSAVSIFLGTGAGTFTPFGSVHVGNAPVFVTVHDVNNDGNADLLVANNRSANISVALGNGDGTFQDAVNIATDSLPNWIAVGDFNGDGWPDLAVVNAVPANNIVILLGNGNGFSPGQVIPAGGVAPMSLVAGDFTSNGVLDLLVVNAYSDNLSFLKGNGDGTFQNPRTLPAGLTPRSVTMADFNRDGLPDAIVTNHESSSVSVYINNPNPSK